MMEIICDPISFNRWQASLLIDGVVECSAISPYPGCAVKDVMNEFFRKYSASSTIKLQIMEWE